MLEIRPPVTPWEGLEQDQKLELLRHLLESEGFLYLIHFAWMSKLAALQNLAREGNSRDQDLFLKGYISGLEFCEGSISQTVDSLRGDQKQEVANGG